MPSGPRLFDNPGSLDYNLPDTWQSLVFSVQQGGLLSWGLPKMREITFLGNYSVRQRYVLFNASRPRLGGVLGKNSPNKGEFHHPNLPRMGDLAQAE